MLGRIFSVVLLCFSVSACSLPPTGYQDSKSVLNGFGFSEKKVSETSYLVSARANSFTSADRLRKIILLRSAVLTRDSGYSHFDVLIGTGVFSSYGHEAIDPLLAYRGGGGYRVVTYYRGGGAVAPILTGSLLIQMNNGGKKATFATFNAKKVIAKLQPQLAAQ